MQARCPSCGSSLQFKSEQSAYVVCSACQTLVARKGLDVEAIGNVAALQADGSLLRIGTQGVFQGQSFEIVGRIQVALGPVERPDVIWNEWYATFSKGESGWIGEAQGEYFVSFVRPAPAGCPSQREVRLGYWLDFEGEQAVVTSLAYGTALGFEGELPFVMSTSYQALFADVCTPSGRAATLDYSEDPPMWFQGRWCGFDELKLRGLRAGDDDDSGGVAIAEANLKSLKCPSCGAPHELKAGGISQSLVCGFCDTIMDLNQDATFREVLRFEQARAKVPALIPLGTQGRLPGSAHDYTCIGFMRRVCRVDGVAYRWSEYLLYEPTAGYRWLTESNGQWSVLQPLHQVPSDAMGRPVGLPPMQELKLGRTGFKHFQRTQTEVEYVAGEFPWRVRVGETSEVSDYIAAPQILSADLGESEVNWSLGTYLTGAQIWSAFKLTGRPPVAHGVANNQPNPYAGAVSRRWIVYLLAVACAMTFLIYRSLRQPEPFFSQTFPYKAYEANRVQVVTVTVPPGRHNLQIRADASLDKRWAYLLLSLIDEKTQQVHDTAISLYQESGVEDGEVWADAHMHDSVQLAHIDGGKYQLRIEPQSNLQGRDQPEGPGAPVDFPPTLFSYTIGMQTDVPQWGYFWMLVLLGLIPPLWTTWRSSSFETARWSESDHAPD